MSQPFDYSSSSAEVLWYARCANKLVPIMHICVQDDRSMDGWQNALKVEGPNHNLLRTEVIREESQFATIWPENCHRHSAIHPQLSCEPYLPTTSICKLPRDTSMKKYQVIQQARKLQATLVRNYRRLTDWLTGVKCRATSVAKKSCTWPHMWSSFMLNALPK